jgi:hypothetical protein
MLIVASGGLESRNVFGDVNSTNGLRFLNRFTDLEKIKNTNPKSTKYDFDLHKDVVKRWVDFDGIPAYTITNNLSIKKVNNIVQYVWLYSFYHHYKIKKDKPKLPKNLYRGIRVFQGLKGKEIEQLRKVSQEQAKGIDDKHTTWVKTFIDNLIQFIVEKGMSKISDGKFLSFTESRDIAAYFANKEGIILRVDPTKVKIVTSPKTEEFFGEVDYVSGKKEKEYIIEIPVNYKFTIDDIEIVDGDYWIGANSPLSVQFFDHDDKKANYELDGIRIESQYVWRSNTSGGIVFNNLDSKGYESWGISRREFKKKFNVDPMPTEENLNRIKDFKISNTKRW